MKKIFRFFLFIILLFAFAVVVYAIYLKFYANKGNTDAFNTVPKESVFIIETTNLSQAWTSIEKSDFWKHLSNTNYFGNIDNTIKSINLFLDSNTIASKLVKNRKLIVSAVMYTPKQWGLLFSIDLGKGKSTIQALDKIIDFIDGYKVKRSKITVRQKKYDFIEMQDKKNPKDKIFIAYANNILLVSFDGNIIEKSLEELDDKHWNKDKYFTEIMQKIPNRKLFKIYVNYKELDNFVAGFVTQKDPTVQMLSQSLAYSVLNLDLSGDMLNLDGYANLDSIGGSYIQTLAKLKPGRMTAYKIMTNQTAAYVSISFDNYTNFYNKLLSEYRKNSPKEAQDIDRYMNLLKNIIKIDVQKDLFSWIGNEIALFKIRPITNNSKAQDVVITINANNISDARNGMQKITNQIRKWSPFKFKAYDYKNFQINYLKEKNFFKPFFGKMLTNMQDAYFTYIQNFVVFSNSESILKQIIDDYISGQTLNNDTKFKNFINKFENKNTFGIFINMPKMYQTLYFYTPVNQRNQLKDNEILIKSFARIGFQLVSKNDMFRTCLKAQYDSTAYYEDLTQIMSLKTQQQSFNAYIDSMNFIIHLPDTVADGDYVEYFDTAKTKIKIEGKVLNGLPDGLWRSYYPSGNIKSAVTYKDGQPEGIAYFYYDDVSNTLQAQMTFVQGKIDGLYKEYYNTGAKKAYILYIDGEKEGKAEFYYKSGDIKIRGKFKNGKRNGKWIYFDENGKKITVQKWKKGKKIR
jgi:antitoxin component YwqK of YwqJK toxin-antitoxin module